jgi:elongation factor P
MHIPLKRGMLIRHQNHIYTVANFEERRTGKMKATVHVSLRDVRDGHPVDRNLTDLEPIDEVPHENRSMQYLYPQGAERVFMDSESFEQYSLAAPQLHGCEPFLKEGEEYRVTFVDGQPLSLQMPEVVVLKVSETAAPSHQVGGSSNVLKEATLENRLEVRVPLFIKMGDTIRVDTRNKSYVGKEGH